MYYSTYRKVQYSVYSDYLYYSAYRKVQYGLIMVAFEDLKNFKFEACERSSSYGLYYLHKFYGLLIILFYWKKRRIPGD